ncbi:hypothetical protein [Paraclostridium dentum]|uniref:hypothetical protein n=1 Tax=Paraclostridium dentum TaxID=2662455 RepID=UPI003B00D7D5
MVDWIISNKEWFLSGLGILIITSIGSVIKFILGKNKDSSNGNGGFNQRQKGGKGSTNIQIGQINKK